MVSEGVAAGAEATFLTFNDCSFLPFTVSPGVGAPSGLPERVNERPAARSRHPVLWPFGFWQIGSDKRRANEGRTVYQGTRGGAAGALSRRPAISGSI